MPTAGATPTAGLILPAALIAAAQSPEELLRTGQRWLDAGNSAAAVRSFRRLVEAFPDSRAHYYLGVALLRDGRPAEAVDSLRRAEALAPAENPALSLSLGTALLRSGDPENAVSVLREAVDRHPPSNSHADSLAVPLLLQLGYAHYSRLDGESARSVLLKARAAAPENPLPHFYLGLAEAALGRLLPAAAAFREAVRLDPGNPEVRVALGRTLSRLDRSEEARREYEAAIQGAPGWPAALVGLGMLDLREGDPEAAAASFENALREAPRHRQALYNLATALSLLGQDEKAAEVRRRFHTVAGEDAAEGGRRAGQPRARPTPRRPEQ